MWQALFRLVQTAIAWGSASFIASEVTEIVTPNPPTISESTGKETPAVMDKSFLENYKDNFKRTWKKKLIIALLSGVLMVAIIQMLKKYQIIKEK